MTCCHTMTKSGSSSPPPPTYLSTSSSRAVVPEQGNEGIRASVQDQATLLVYSTA